MTNTFDKKSLLDVIVGQLKINKEGKKKAVKPKKPRYNKSNEGGKTPPSEPRKNREYKVADFKAIIFNTVTAASSPLLPCLPPALSSAC